MNGKMSEWWGLGVVVLRDGTGSGAEEEMKRWILAVLMCEVRVSRGEKRKQGKG